MQRENEPTPRSADEDTPQTPWEGNPPAQPAARRPGRPAARPARPEGPKPAGDADRSRRSIERRVHAILESTERTAAAIVEDTSGGIQRQMDEAKRRLEELLVDSSTQVGELAASLTAREHRLQAHVDRLRMLGEELSASISTPDEPLPAQPTGPRVRTGRSQRSEPELAGDQWDSDAELAPRRRGGAKDAAEPPMARKPRDPRELFPHRPQ